MSLGRLRWHPDRQIPLCDFSLSQEKASAEIRGEFFRTNSRVNFAVDFLVDLFGPFSLEKKEEKIHPKIHGNFQIRIWEFRGQNPHCKDPALIFIGFFLSTINIYFLVRISCRHSRPLRPNSPNHRATVGVPHSDPQTVESKGISDHFLQILENLRF